MANNHIGYNPQFLGSRLPFPRMDSRQLAPLLQTRGKEIRYTHFSVFVHRERRLPLLTAVNIKGEAYSARSREGSEPWDHCNQIDRIFQIDNRFYGNDENTFDRGHLVRRVDPCWGVRAISDQAELDTFQWVNCTPQHRKLNRQGGVWFQLEQHIMENGVKNRIGDISVFSGPVLDKNDFPFKKKYLNTPVPIPLVYWKVIVWKKNDGHLYAVGFMMSQWEWIKSKIVAPPALLRELPTLKEDHFEKLKFDDHKTYQVPLAAIENATGIRFDWPEVRLPYQAQKFKAVRAVPLKKVYPFSQVTDTYNQLRVLRKGPVPGSTLQRELQQLPPLPASSVRQFIKEGQGYLLRRYKLTHITL